MSNSRARRPMTAAATPVIPDPANGSSTTCPGLVKASMNGVMPPTGIFVRELLAESGHCSWRVFECYL